jgi:hypothetical protein
LDPALEPFDNAQPGGQNPRGDDQGQRQAQRDERRQEHEQHREEREQRHPDKFGQGS